MRELARTGHDDARQRPRSAPRTSAAPRCLELQRAAGNRAVTRVLARLDEKDVEDIKKDRKLKRIWDAAFKTWDAAFGINGTHKASAYHEPWPDFVKAATSVEKLQELVEAAVANAAKSAKSAKSAPPPLKEEKEEKKEKEEKTPMPSPAAATTGG